MKRQSKTDWDRVKSEFKANQPISVDLGSEPYDPNDDAAVFAHWEKAKVIHGGEVIAEVRRRGPAKQPTKKQVAIRFDVDVLDGLKASGKGWQTRVNNVMRAWLETHQVK